MQRIDVERWPKNRAVALFESSAVSFEMVSKASFTDLVERLTNIGTNQDGALIGVTVQIGAKKNTFRINGRGRGQKRDRR